MNKRKIHFILIFLLIFALFIIYLVSSIFLSTNINKKKVTIIVGETMFLKINGFPKKVTWESDNKNIAIVNNKGVVTGINEGSTVITGTAKKKSYKCVITVCTFNSNTSDEDKHTGSNSDDGTLRELDKSRILTNTTGQENNENLNSTISEENSNFSVGDFNVMDYGAVGDGKTDDSIAIQNAIDAAYTNGNGSVIFPPSKKFVCRNINLKSGITIIGNGSSIINDINVDNYSNPTIKLNGSATLTTTILTDNVLCGANSGDFPINISVNDATGFSVGDDIELSDTNGKEFNIIKAINGNIITLRNRPIRDYFVIKKASITKLKLLKDVTINNLVIKHNNPYENSILLSYAINCNFNKLIIDNPEQAIYIENSERITINECRITPNSLTTDTSRGVAIMNTSRYCKVVNCSFYHGRPAVLSGGDFNIVSNNTIIASGGGSTGDGISVWGSDNVIDGNTIIGGDCYGIWIEDSGSNIPKRVSVTNNVIESGITIAVYVNSGYDHIISGNTIYKNSSGVVINGASGCIVSNNIITENSNIGIQLMTSDSRCIITANRCKNNADYGLYMYDGSDYNIVKDNIMDGLGILRVNASTHNVVKDNILNGNYVPSGGL